MEQIKADIESGSVRQDSLETLISLLSKHTDQRFVNVAKEMKKQVWMLPPASHEVAFTDAHVQGELVEGVHKRMDRVCGWHTVGRCGRCNAGL
jgi:hypothetical protein